ncbi:hypothetical protein HHK36_018351 [Tetracentron sinense]|uniref:Uncharacterized protein n=1 Tax=Tetracentron sinense TaxID=13715 RepID=A0A835DDG0_TETSI|nr:hypothetical protein HHK36_018351 [Tetracentron sinense]
MDLFCASPTSTAICVSMDQRSMVRHSSRAIDHQNPHMIDGRRNRAPSSSQPPMNPKPYRQKSRNNTAKQTRLTSPPGSSRYLLSDTSFFDGSPDLDPVSALVPIDPTRTLSIYPDQSPALKPSSSTRSDHDLVYWKSLSVYVKPLSVFLAETPALKPSSSTHSRDQINNWGVMALANVNRGDILQYRFRDHEGDDYWGRYSSRCACKRVKGEERAVLDIFITVIIDVVVLVTDKLMEKENEVIRKFH